MAGVADFSGSLRAYSDATRTIVGGLDRVNKLFEQRRKRQEDNWDNQYDRNTDAEIAAIKQLKNQQALAAEQERYTMEALRSRFGAQVDANKVLKAYAGQDERNDIPLHQAAKAALLAAQNKEELNTAFEGIDQGAIRNFQPVAQQYNTLLRGFEQDKLDKQLKLAKISQARSQSQTDLDEAARRRQLVAAEQQLRGLVATPGNTRESVENNLVNLLTDTNKYGRLGQGDHNTLIGSIDGLFAQREDNLTTDQKALLAQLESTTQNDTTVLKQRQSELVSQLTDETGYNPEIAQASITGTGLTREAIIDSLLQMKTGEGDDLTFEDTNAVNNAIDKIDDTFLAAKNRKAHPEEINWILKATGFSEGILPWNDGQFFSDSAVKARTDDFIKQQELNKGTKDDFTGAMAEIDDWFDGASALIGNHSVQLNQRTLQNSLRRSRGVDEIPLDLDSNAEEYNTALQEQLSFMPTLVRQKMAQRRAELEADKKEKQQIRDQAKAIANKDFNAWLKAQGIDHAKQSEASLKLMRAEFNRIYRTRRQELVQQSQRTHGYGHGNLFNK